MTKLTPTKVTKLRLDSLKIMRSNEYYSINIMYIAQFIEIKKKMQTQEGTKQEPR